MNQEPTRIAESGAGSQTPSSGGNGTLAVACAPQAAVLPLGRVWTGLLVFYGVALLLNAASLHLNNQRLPYGPVRSFWVSVSAPVARLSERAGFHRLRDGLAETAGAALNP
jgi:hypothetical protein